MASYSSRHLSSVCNKLDSFSSNEGRSMVYCSFWIFRRLKAEENESQIETCFSIKHYFDGIVTRAAWRQQSHCALQRRLHAQLNSLNLLAPELFFLILAYPVYKMWITQEPNTLKLWNKLHFEEKKRRLYTMFKIFSKLLNKYIKCNV